MKLFQINTTSNWGSTGRIAEEIGQQVIAEGWDSYIAYGRHSNDSTSKQIRIGTDWDVFYHVFQTRLFDRHGLVSKASTSELIKRIEDISPDIIHLHNIHGYYLNYPILFEYLHKIEIPVVWTLHDCWTFTGHCSHYTYINCERWKNGCYDCPQKKTYPKSCMIDRSEKNFRDKKKWFTLAKNVTLVTVSKWLKDEVMSSFLKYYPVQIIHNGIDIEIFTPLRKEKSELGIDDRFVILGVASVWSPHKGLEDFIKLRQMLGYDFLIVLIGVNDKQIENLPKGIVGIKRTNSIQELVQYYSIADVFLNPTWEDNFPTTNLEALACGTPVITYRTGGSIEAIDESTGFVVEQGDLESVIAKINIIKRLGKVAYESNCRERAVRLYDKKIRYSEYMQLYEGLLKDYK